MNILEIQNLTHIFPDGTIAINDINLSIEEGDFAIIAGTNGSGKTVLLRHLNGLLLPTKGQIFLKGQPITKNITNTRQQIGLIFQDSDSQIVGQTVAEDVAFGPENLKLPHEEIRNRVTQCLEAVGLSHVANQRPHLLSGGQKRKLAVAGVLAMKPQVIAFDEPFTGLDYHGIVQVLTQIISLHKIGHTIIIVTHELEKVLAHASRLIIMDRGKVVKDGKPDNIIDQVEKYGIKIPYGNSRGVETMTWLN